MIVLKKAREEVDWFLYLIKNVPPEAIPIVSKYEPSVWSTPPMIINNDRSRTEYSDLSEEDTEKLKSELSAAGFKFKVEEW